MEIVFQQLLPLATAAVQRPGSSSGQPSKLLPTGGISGADVAQKIRADFGLESEDSDSSYVTLPEQQLPAVVPAEVEAVAAEPQAGKFIFCQLIDW